MEIIMEQYIKKSDLVAEIEKLIENGKLKYKQSKENNDYESYVAWSEHIATCGKILSLIDTLEMKEIGVDVGSPEGDLGRKTVQVIDDNGNISEVTFNKK